MTTKTKKEVYSADMLSRFPDHSFTETAVGSATRVEFLDGASAVVFESVRLDLNDAYQNIRENVVGTSDEAGLHDEFSTGQTTDNTATVIATIPIDDEAVYNIQASLLGIESDNSNRASYVILGSFYRTGAGNAIQIGSTTSIHGVETAPAWTGAAFAVSGVNVQVTAQGAVATTINWQVVNEILEL